MVYTGGTPEIEPEFHLGTFLGRKMGAGLESGLQSSITNAYEARTLENALKDLGENATPEQRFQAIVGAPVSREAKTPILQGMASLEKARRQQTAMQQKKSQEMQKDEMIRKSGLAQADWLEKHAKTSAGWKWENIGFPGGQKWGENVEFTRRGAILADKAYNYLNKGTMSDAKLKMVMSVWAPTSMDTEETALGKIRALRSAFEIDPNISDDQFDLELEKRGLGPDGRPLSGDFSKYAKEAGESPTLKEPAPKEAESPKKPKRSLEELARRIK